MRNMKRILGKVIACPLGLIVVVVGAIPYLIYTLWDARRPR